MSLNRQTMTATKGRIIFLIEAALRRYY